MLANENNHLTRCIAVRGCCVSQIVNRDSKWLPEASQKLPRPFPEATSASAGGRKAGRSEGWSVGKQAPMVVISQGGSGHGQV